jgi:signal peptidase I
MSFDLEWFLVLGVLITGLIWLADRLWLRGRRRVAGTVAEGPQGELEAVGSPAEPWYVEYSRSFFPVLLIVLLLRSFIVEPFRIPSGSMMPTLLVGDFILVNKFAYGLRLPITHGKILGVGEPRRGDVAVFRFPANEDTDYIKRIVGLPGDRILYRNKVLYVNGERVEQESIGPEVYRDARGVARKLLRLSEDLGQVEHDILVVPGYPNAEGEYLVPEGQYFVLGDNRDNSNDSRFWGFVPEANLVGKAFVIWMNWDFGEGTANLSRIGTGIH